MELEILQKALQEADRQIRETNGHYYVHMLKTRCVNCGRSEKVKTRCGGWFNTFIKRLEEIYMNKNHYPEIFN